MGSNNKIAFIGSVGVPNVYGGFESFLEVTVPVFVSRGYDVYVTCDDNKYLDKSRIWHGAIREFIKIPANGAHSLIHDFIAFFRVFSKVEVIVVLGVSAGLFFPLFRLLCEITNKKLIVNVDGLEWRRTKFGFLKRCFLKLSDTFAQWFSGVVIIDNRALFDFLTYFGSRKSVYIPYSGDYVLNVPCKNFKKSNYLLSICRIEPENNCEVILNSFAKVGYGEFIFVGNWSASSFGLNLRSKFKNVAGLYMLDPIYDGEKLAMIRSSCVAYIHGHSVGGTNPSLVEMLFYDCPIAAFDCVFNRDTADSDVDYFVSEYDLLILMRSYYLGTTVQKRFTRSRFTTTAIINSYIKIFEG